MKSMTGFGRARVNTPELAIVADLSSVNKRGLEISVSLPREWQPMEFSLAQKLKNTFVRGKICASIKVELNDKSRAYSINPEAISSALKELGKLCAECGVPYNPTADTIVRINESFKDSSTSLGDWESALAYVDKAHEEAAEKLDEMRRIEGEALSIDLKMRLQSIFDTVCEVERHSRNSAEKYKEQLLQRLATSGLELDISDERVLKEVCIFADKCDICEEITRLKSHISQFLSAMGERDAVGRKMDFICQEMGREINTIASKAANIDITKLAIALKNELERIREQIQNIE